MKRLSCYLVVFVLCTITSLPVIAQNKNVPLLEDIKSRLGYPFFGVLRNKNDHGTEDTKMGVKLIEIRLKSPMKEAGFKSGDVIESFNGIKVSKHEELIRAINKSPVGKEIEVVTVKRQRIRKIRKRTKIVRTTTKVKLITYRDWLYSVVNIDKDEVENITDYSFGRSEELIALQAELGAAIAKLEGRVFIPAVRSSFSTSFSKYPDGTLRLFVYAKYRGSSWMFLDKLIFRIGKEKFEFSLEESRVSRSTTTENFRAVVIERYIDFPDKRMREVLEKIANSSKAIVRLSGKDGYMDVKMSDRERTCIAVTLALYDDAAEQP